MAAQPPRARRSSRPKLDLAELITNADQLAKLVIERPESVEERAVRLREQNTKTTLSFIKESVVFVLVVIGIVLVVAYCLSIMQNPAASPDEKKWEQTIIASAVTAGIGYLLGRRG